MEAVRQCLGEERIWLFGNSMGGGVSWGYALEHPEKLEGLVLVNSAGSLALADAPAAFPSQPWRGRADR